MAKYLINYCEEKNWKLIGPAPSLISKVGKKFRWQILMHGPEIQIFLCQKGHYYGNLFQKMFF